MALAQKGSRLIVVDGVSFRWAVTARFDADPGFVVELAEQPGRRLVWSTSDYACAPVTPSRVAAGIEAARGMGWDPHLPGADFLVVNGRPSHPAVGSTDG
ncbi:hypothetical protein AB0M36_16455 [Actinoplanes sp. NPDC051346]|uniref:hypothetical protein n=1 Tax=Actinoplanes sp. NPDC051346 TaxID=3155048 RepID=UPI00341F50EB